MKDSNSKGDTSVTTSGGEGDAIRVFLRVRPPDSGSAALPMSGRVVEVNDNGKSITLLAKPDPKVFTFDHVADTNSTQESVFSTVGKSLIESCVTGYNGTIFAYGQTGSGKTFTMLGPSEECDNFKHEQRGVIPRSFEHLFNLINREHEMHGDRKQFLCKCSFLEIYQEQVYDLLDPAAANLQLRENIKKGVFVDGLMEQVVTTPTEAYQALSTGWLNRRVAATSMNRESSRSHAVFTLFIESKEEKNGVKNVRESQLNLVDLAGSERQKDTNTVGIRLKEAGKINQSLSVLGNVIMSLVKIAQGKTQHIPYRDSKLTFLLRDSLGGNARTSIVACVHPDGKCFGETLSTLNFAKRAKQIKNKAVVNEDTQGNVAHLQTEIRRLREMLQQAQNNASIPQPLTSEGGDGVNGGVASSSAFVSDEALQEWRSKFFEAMLFRDKAEQEKEGIRQQLRLLEEDGKKKDRVVQSSRLIIKLRESTIAKLEKQLKAAADPNIAVEPEYSPATTKLLEDMQRLKALLDQYPQVSQMDQKLHTVRAQLTDARIRLSNTTANLLDSNRLAQLEETFTELQQAAARQNTAASTQDNSGSSPYVEGTRSAASMQKLRERSEALENELEQVKKQATEDRQAWESLEAKLQSELTATQRTNQDLKRLLEANHLKHRMQNEEFNTMHNHIIKALTPTRVTYDLRNRTVVVNPDLQGNGEGEVTVSGSAGSPERPLQLEAGPEEEDICMQSPPPDMVESASEVLTEEIKALQQSNSSLQERLNEYESDMVRVTQQITQLELEKSSINEILSKERADGAERLAEQEKTLRDLRASLESLTTDLKCAKEEARDYQLLLTSSDKELKSAKQKGQSQCSEKDQNINALQTQLLQAQCMMETLSKQVEEENKEREAMEEKLETERLEKAFLEETLTTTQTSLESAMAEAQDSKLKLQELEARLVAEKEEQQRLQERSQEYGQQEERRAAELGELRSKIEDVTKDCEEKRRQLDAMATELQTSKATSADLKRDVTDTREALQQQVQRVQELKAKLQEEVDRCSVLQDQASCQAAETADARREVASLKTQLQTCNDQLDAAAVQKEMLNEDLAFYCEQNEKAVAECSSLRQTIDALEDAKEKLQKEIQTLKTEIVDRDGRLQQITLALEEKHPLQSKDALRSPLASPERLAPLEHSFVHENRLAAMVEELTEGRQKWMEENAQLKRERDSMLEAVKQNEKLTDQCRDLQCQLDNQNTVFKDSIQHLQEVNASEQAEAQTLRESLAAAQRQQDTMESEKQLLTAQYEEAQSERRHAEEELNRLKAVLEKSYKDCDQVQSQLEEMREEYKKTKEELWQADQRLQELSEFNAVLAGHANHAQKIHYVRRLQDDYNNVKEKCDELSKENIALRLKIPVSPLKERTNTQFPPSASKEPKDFKSQAPPSASKEPKDFKSFPV